MDTRSDNKLKRIFLPNRPMNDPNERYFLWKINAILLTALRQGGFVPPEGGLSRDGVLFVNRMVYNIFRESWTSLWESQCKRNAEFPQKKDRSAIRTLDRWFLFNLKSIILTALYALSKLDGLIVEFRPPRPRDAILPYDLKSHLDRIIPQILSDYDIEDALYTNKHVINNRRDEKPAQVKSEKQWDTWSIKIMIKMVNWNKNRVAIHTLAQSSKKHESTSWQKKHSLLVNDEITG